MAIRPTAEPREKLCQQNNQSDSSGFSSFPTAPAALHLQFQNAVLLWGAEWWSTILHVLFSLCIYSFYFHSVWKSHKSESFYEFLQFGVLSKKLTQIVVFFRA